MERILPNQTFVWDLKKGDRIAEWINNKYYYGTVISDPEQDETQRNYIFVEMKWDQERFFEFLGQWKNKPSFGSRIYKVVTEEA